MEKIGSLRRCQHRRRRRRRRRQYQRRRRRRRCRRRRRHRRRRRQYHRRRRRQHCGRRCRIHIDAISGIDYCISLDGAPKTMMDKLQRVMNAASHVSSQTPGNSTTV